MDPETLVPGSGPGGHLIAADVLRRVGAVDAATLEKLGLRPPAIARDERPKTLLEDYEYGWREDSARRTRRRRRCDGRSRVG